MALKRKTESGKPGATEITAMDHFKTVLLGGLGIDAEGTQSDRTKYSKDPVGWVRDRLGEHLWSKQREICESVRDHRLTAVRSCHSSGKALAIDTPLPTPTGWTTMGEVAVGDYLLDENGKPTRVVGRTSVELRASYCVYFNDGTHLKASLEHLWCIAPDEKSANEHDWSKIVTVDTGKLESMLFNNVRVFLPAVFYGGQLLRPARRISAVDAYGMRLVRCVEVDSPHRIYLAGKSYAPTHNSYLASRLAAWWIETHNPGEAFVVTTATTASQVAVVLWREIGRVHAKGNLSGRVTLNNKWYIPTRHGNEEIVAIGIKPKDYDPTALHGIHARYVLVILDEAAGIAEALWTAADSLASGADCRMLAIGNPDFPVGEFVECFGPRSSWKKVHISAFDTPNFTGEEVPDELRHVLASRVWQEEKLLKWGEDNPLYQSKVLGQFPVVNENGLIPVTWIEAARNRTLEPIGPSVLGVDVGGGTDKSVIAHRVGPVVRIKREWSTSNPDTMQTLGMLMQVLKDTEAEVAHVDAVGIGQGIVDRAFDISTDQREKSKSDKSRKVRAGKIKGVKVGSSPKDSETYMNLRAEAYWGLRERFQDGAIDLDPDDEDLAAELADLRFKRTSRGQIQIESKDDMRRRGKPSPDRADAVMLAFCDPNVVRKKTKATWGRGAKDRVPGSVITNIARARAPRPGRSGRR